MGQTSRQFGDGLVTSPNVGASAPWGLVVGNGWIGWMEADRDTLRIASVGGMVPCPIGLYPDAGLCVSCTNPIPFSTAYTTSGILWDGGGGGNNCSWMCPASPHYLPFTCPEFASSIENANLATPGIGSMLQEIVCNEGYEKPSVGASTCQPCSPGFYCNGYNFGRIGRQICPPNSNSTPSSTNVSACTCNQGYYGRGNETCNLCTPNNYCTEGAQDLPIPCPANSSSTQGDNLTIKIFLYLSTFTHSLLVFLHANHSTTSPLCVFLNNRASHISMSSPMTFL